MMRQTSGAGHQRAVQPPTAWICTSLRQADQSFLGQRKHRLGRDAHRCCAGRLVVDRVIIRPSHHDLDVPMTARQGRHSTDGSAPDYTDIRHQHLQSMVSMLTMSRGGATGVFRVSKIRHARRLPCAHPWRLMRHYPRSWHPQPDAERGRQQLLHPAFDAANRQMVRRSSAPGLTTCPPSSSRSQPARTDSRRFRPVSGRWPGTSGIAGSPPWLRRPASRAGPDRRH